MLSRCRSSSSTTSTRRTPWDILASSFSKRFDQLFAPDRLHRVADGAALERLVRVVGDGNDVDRNVARVGVALQLIEDARAPSSRAGSCRAGSRSDDRSAAAIRPSFAECTTMHWKPSSRPRSHSTSANRASSSTMRMRRESCDRRSRSSSKLARGSARGSREPRREAASDGRRGCAARPADAPARGYRERPAPGRPAASA